MKHKSILIALAAVWMSSAQELRVDHVTIAGRDLKTLQTKFARQGIRTEYGGKHTNGLTEMAIASFADGSYLELIAAQDPRAGAAKHDWGKFIDADAGPCAWAIGVSDLDAAAKRLGAEVVSGGRTRADGVPLKWRSAAIGTEPHGTFFPFMIHDETDRALRAFPSGKPTMPELRGVTEVYIGVSDLDDAIKRYQTAFHLANPKRAYSQRLKAQTARFEGTPVVLAALKDRVRKFGESPVAFVVDTVWLQ